jgi:PAS domain-containing protein
MGNSSTPVQVDEMSVLLVVAEMGELGVFVLDADGAISRVNSRFCELLGTEPFMLEDRRREDLRAASGLQGTDVTALQRKDGGMVGSLAGCY